VEVGSVLDAPGLSEASVQEGAEGRQLVHVIGRGWLIGIPAMFLMSVLLIFLATGSAVWSLIIAAWGGVVAGPYFGGFVLLNRGELAADREAELDTLPVPSTAVEPHAA
jgi:hypothetical protein